MNQFEKIIPIPALKDNYIWLFFDKQSNETWIIDPGAADPVFETLKKLQLSLSGILITHHHHDHSGGVKELLTKFNVPVYASYKSPLSFITHRVRQNDEIRSKGIPFKVLEIPGHTLDHLAYVTNSHVFCGDTLFSIGCGKIFEGTPELMYHSLQKLAALPDTTKIYSGHEYTLANLKFAEHIEPHNPQISHKIAQVKQCIVNGLPSLPALLGDEKMLNPFLRCEQPSIIQAVTKYANQSLNNPVEVFAHLREWKNQFS